MRTILIFLMIAGTAFSESVPVPSSVDNSNKDMVWNKWETENFIILSLDFSFGNKMKSSIEKRKDAILSRLGLSQSKLPTKCKLVCVQDKKVLERLFSIGDPKFEIKKDKVDQVKEFAIWIDQDRLNFLDGMIAGVWLHDSRMFLREGLSVLLSGSEAVSKAILSSEEEPSCHIFSETQKTPQSVSDSVLACLFLRREFGIDLFSSIVSSADPDPVYACGFTDDESMNESMARYYNNIKEDLKSGRTPIWYLGD